MKTVNYILRDETNRALRHAGTRIRGRGLPKVVDLAAWRAENLAEPDEPKAGCLPVSAPVRDRGRRPVRRGRLRLLDWAELAATLAVAAAFAALAARVLLF